MINLKNISLQLGTKVLFKDASLIINRSDKIGIIGKNGVGKSSLFAILQGEAHVDKGDAEIPNSLCISTVKQETPSLDCSAVDYVLMGDTAYWKIEQALLKAEAEEDGHKIADLHMDLANVDGYTARSRAAELLHGLGFAYEAIEQPVKSFSGGWRMRLNLAQALMAPSDIMLLDEPTNHLDMETVIWLEQWLKTYPGILLVISHDKEFLDNVITSIVHIEQQKMTRFKGDFTSFERQYAEQLMQQSAAVEKQQREKAHIQSFVDRFRAKASKARQAQSRLKALERFEDLAPIYANSPFTFSFFETHLKSQAYLLQIKDATLGYGEKVILEDVNFAISPGDRIGLLGPNGAGKSTLIKALAQSIPLLKGELLANDQLKLGYFSQHQMESLNEKESAFWHIQQLSPKVRDLDIRNFLGSFDFVSERAFEPIGKFSGGEKARLALAVIVWQKPNVLLLDEPTNHLDMDMREALVCALQDYEGAVITVSHDRHLLRSTMDQFYTVFAGKVAQFDGDIEDYSAWLAQELKDAKPKKIAAVKAEPKQERNNTKKPLLQKLKKAEAEIEALQAELKLLQEDLSHPERYSQANALQELMNKQTTCQNKLALVEASWLELSEQIESME
ncbi:MAG: ATP-binding cassette domain-containing protein [Gammaproteobacteria bacterium]|nr:ATP-binding cassette domain-containing protein [Gammaproteobacteria bacterium]